MPCVVRRVAEAVLLGAHPAQGHGVDELQVARVEAQRQVHLAARERWSSRSCSPGDTSRRRGRLCRRESTSSNSRKICRGLLPMMLASTFSRPRCAMPSTISSTPCSPAFSIARSSSGIRLSPPSSEKLLAPMYFFCMNSSKMTASVSRVRMRSCSSRVELDAVLGRLPCAPAASRARSRSSMCMNCTPIERQ